MDNGAENVRLILDHLISTCCFRYWYMVYEPWRTSGAFSYSDAHNGLCRAHVICWGFKSSRDVTEAEDAITLAAR